MEHGKDAPGGELEPALERKSESSGPLSVKVPIRIKSGSFDGEYLHIITSCDERKIPWSHINYICLGCIEETVGGSEAPKSGMRNVIRKLLFGDKQDDRAKKQTRLQYILDIFVENNEAAFRFDSVNINYKSFLGDVSYISFHNFKRLFQIIVEGAKKSHFNRSAIALLKKRQDRVHRYPSVYDFELDCQQARAHLGREIHWTEIEKEVDLEERATERMETDGDDISDMKLRVIDGILDDETGDFHD